MAALQHMLGQPLGAAGVGRASVQDGFHQWEFRTAIGQPGAADHIAYHVHVGLQGHLVGAKAFDEFDAQGAQLVTHGGVDAGVAAGHFVASLAGQRCHATHEGAANAKNVYVHGPILRGGMLPNRPLALGRYA